ncbi:TLC domain-containing protein [Phthorimaea operculella]|nr:TLC domain-containing protein [Phthorimaea operculella]
MCGLPTFQRCTERVGLWHSMLLFWSWGYFAFDLSWCIYYWPRNWLMLVHHGSALAAITLYMGKPDSGCIVPCGLALMEATNPLLQARWFLRENGYDKTTIYFIVEWTYLFLFVALRGVIGTIVMIEILATDTNAFLFDDKIVFLLLYIVSIALIIEIIGYVLYKYRTQYEEFRGILLEAGMMVNYQL